MNQQKVVSRKTAVGLGLIVIVLFTALIAVTALYLQTSAGSQIFNPPDNKDTQIAELNSQIDDLNSILNLEKNETVVKNFAVNQGPNSGSTVIERGFMYSGYLLVSGTSTTDNAYVKLEYWFDGKLYSFNQTLGTSSELFFAIPKTEAAAIYAGNTNPVEGATETLTIIYHY
jgi:hypothetical protein